MMKLEAAENVNGNEDGTISEEPAVRTNHAVSLSFDLGPNDVPHGKR